MAERDEFEMLRRAVGEPAPADGRRQEARARLDRAIAAEEAANRLRRPRRVARVAFAASLLALVGALYFTVWSGVPASALHALAHAARAVDPIEVPPGQFVYTRSERLDLGALPGSLFEDLNDEEVAYLLPRVTESWLSEDGFVQLVTTTHRPVFFESRVEVAYYQAGMDLVDRVGETVTETYADVGDPLGGVTLPTDAEALRSVMDELIPSGDGQPPREVRLLRLAATILRERAVEPQLRAAVLEVLATLSLDTVATEAGLTVSVTYVDWARIRYAITFDAEGHLVAESTTLIDDVDVPYVPAGIIGHATYTVPVVVPDLERPER